jgi:acyl-coenzyme A thioesterase PaaI-like protein
MSYFRKKIETMENALSKLVGQFKNLPEEEKIQAMSKAVGSFVKFTGFCGLRYEKMTQHEVVVSLENKPEVQNHIHQIHATAMILLAETATGMVVGMNVPDDRVMLVKSLNTAFVKRSTGAMRASATLSDEQIRLIHETEKGEVVVPVVITDEVGVEPIKVEAIWAWIPKSHLKK